MRDLAVCRLGCTRRHSRTKSWHAKPGPLVVSLAAWKPLVLGPIISTSDLLKVRGPTSEEKWKDRGVGYLLLDPMRDC